MPELEFEGKSVVYAHHLSVPIRTLGALRATVTDGKEGRGGEGREGESLRWTAT